MTVTAIRICEIEGCGGTHWGKGYCRSHYRRWSRGRDPRQPSRREMTYEERFWSHVEVADCWTWTAARNHGGYGLFRAEGGVQVIVHRWAWMHLVGPIGEGLQIDHLCRNRACVNPDHLEPVTAAENTARSSNRGGAWHRLGTCFRGHPLSEENVAVQKNGDRKCRACTNARRRAADRTRRAKAKVHQQADGRS